MDRSRICRCCFLALERRGRIPAKVKNKMMEDPVVRDAVGLNDMVVEES